MSTKIYEAWRFPSTHLNEYLDWARGQMWAAAKERVLGLMEALKPEVIEGFGECPAHFKDGEGGEAIWERHKRMDHVLDFCREAAKSRQRDTIFDIECGLNIWLHEGMFYVIPIAEYWLSSTLREPPDWVEEYHYQNSTDQPNDISAEAWEQRRATWEAVCTDSPSNHNRRRLFFEVIAAKTAMDTFELETDIAGRDMRIFLDG